MAACCPTTSDDPAPHYSDHYILIITGQQRYDTIAELGFPHMETPNLDRLAREGVAFTQCHVTASSCAPSRASLFTGFYPHTTGILRNADQWQHSWVERLAGSGYYCVNVGKMHTWPYDTPMGFHERYVVENKDRYLEGRYYFDEKVGQILASLAAKGYLDNAVITFTSDHGDALGDHGHSQKWTMYDVVTRVPLIVWAPGSFDGGRQVDGLWQLMDVALDRLCFSTLLRRLTPPPQSSRMKALASCCSPATPCRFSPASPAMESIAYNVRQRYARY